MARTCMSHVTRMHRMLHAEPYVGLLILYVARRRLPIYVDNTSLIYLRTTRVAHDQIWRAESVE